MFTLLSTAGVPTPVLTVVPPGEIRFLVTAVPIGLHRKGEQKGGGLKTQREEVTSQTSLVAPCSPSCTVLKDTVPTADPSNKTLEEAKEQNLIQ